MINYNESRFLTIGHVAPFKTQTTQKKLMYCRISFYIQKLCLSIDQNIPFKLKHFNKLIFI